MNSYLASEGRKEPMINTVKRVDAGGGRTDERRSESKPKAIKGTSGSLRHPPRLGFDADHGGSSRRRRYVPNTVRSSPRSLRTRSFRRATLLQRRRLSRHDASSNIDTSIDFRRQHEQMNRPEQTSLVSAFQVPHIRCYFTILGVEVNHLVPPPPQEEGRRPLVLCPPGGFVGTLEGQVFVTQRGEALLHHLIGHFLQRGGVPLGTLVLVYQNCRRGQTGCYVRSRRRHFLDAAETHRLVRPRRSRSLSAGTERRTA